MRTVHEGEVLILCWNVGKRNKFMADQLSVRLFFLPGMFRFVYSIKSPFPWVAVDCHGLVMDLRWACHGL